MNNKELYEYIDKLETLHFARLNKLVNSARLKYRNKIIQDIKEKELKNLNYMFNANISQEISAKLFDDFDKLNRIVFEDISKHYYEQGAILIEKFVDKEVERKFNKKNVDKYLKLMLTGQGLHYNYNDELVRRRDYFNVQMVGGLNASMQQELNGKTSDNFAKTLEDSINLYSLPMAETMSTQKKQIANFFDNVFTFVAAQSMLEVYKDNKIKKVLRHAEIDSHTCKYCESQDKRVYNIDDTIDIPSHTSCRCWLEPIIEEGTNE